MAITPHAKAIIPVHYGGVPCLMEGIGWEEDSLRVVGKGDKERRIDLKPDMLQCLRHYVRGARVEDYLFPGQADRAVTARQMDQRIKEYVRAAKVPVWVTPHVLRHSIAVHYLLGGAALSFVQDLLGLTSLATTGICTRLTDPMTKEIALPLPSALDLPPAGPAEKVSREERAAYAAEVEYWDRLVSDVWEWPGEGRG